MEYLTYLLPVGIGGIVAFIAWAALGKIGTKTTAAKEVVSAVPPDFTEQYALVEHLTAAEKSLRDRGDIPHADQIAAMIPGMRPFGWVTAEAAK